MPQCGTGSWQQKILEIRDKREKLVGRRRSHAQLQVCPECFALTFTRSKLPRHYHQGQRKKEHCQRGGLGHQASQTSDAAGGGHLRLC
jgi:hypothetical protein